MGEALPVWERHAWQLLSPCTDGWRCIKCDAVSPVASKVERCSGPAVSGPAQRSAWWSCLDPVWVWAWPDGQHQQTPADRDEHLQARRYALLVRQLAAAPVRAAWLDSHLRAVPPSTWLPPNAPDESAPAPREYTLDEALNVALGLHKEGIAGAALGLTDAQVEKVLREAGKFRAEPDADALDRVRRRLGLGGEP